MFHTSLFSLICRNPGSMWHARTPQSRASGHNSAIGETCWLRKAPRLAPPDAYRCGDGRRPKRATAARRRAEEPTALEAGEHRGERDGHGPSTGRTGGGCESPAPRPACCATSAAHCAPRVLRGHAAHGPPLRMRHPDQTAPVALQLGKPSGHQPDIRPHRLLRSRLTRPPTLSLCRLGRHLAPRITPRDAHTNDVGRVAGGGPLASPLLHPDPRLASTPAATRDCPFKL